jgi:parvulin-like peptidyl-prolyl isomerase
LLVLLGVGGVASADGDKPDKPDKPDKSDKSDKKITSPNNGKKVHLERVVAIVNDAIILQSELDARLVPVRAEAEQITDLGERKRRIAKLASQTLDEMVSEELIVQAAQAAKIEVESTEVQAALDEIKQQNNLDDAGLDAALKANGYTRARYMVDLEHQLMILRVRNQDMHIAAVTDAEVEAEAKARDMKVPLSTADSDKLRQELRRRRLDAAAPIWAANLRKRFHIEKFP